jgi:DNA repair exonuclease SbcCD ATPase subunit
VRIVELNSVVIHNFRSFKDATVVFPTSPGLRFMGGENLEEPGLGANGCGKSSLWQSVRWCFYGDTNKTTRISNLTTWGQETTSVTIHLSVAGKKHVIERQGPPVYVYLDKVRVDQAAIDNLLGLQCLAFQHSVLFSQEQLLFPDLAVSERNELLEDVLNLSYWSRCVETATTKYGLEEEKQRTEEKKLAYVRGQIQSLPSMVQLGAQAKQWDEHHAFVIQDLRRSEINWDADHEHKLREAQTQLSQWESDRSNRLAKAGAQQKDWELQRQCKISQLFTKISVWTEEAELELEQMVERVDALEAELKVIEPRLQRSDNKQGLVRAERAEEVAREKLTEAQNARAEAKTSLSTAKDEFNTFKLNGTCYACGQPIVTTLAKLTKKVDKAKQLADEAQAEVERCNAELKPKIAKVVELRAAAEAEENRLSSVKSQFDTLTSQHKRYCAEVASKLRALESNPYQDQIKGLREEANPYLEQEARIRDEANPYRHMLQVVQAESNPYPNLVAEALAQPNPHKEALERTKRQQAALNAEERAVSERITTHHKRLTAIDYWKQGFKRIRLYLTQKVLVALEVDINSAISTLGMEGWHVKLSTETETKSGTVKLGVQIQVNSPKASAPWESWSGGESQRLRVAMALGVAGMIQRARGSWWGIEIYDEQSTYLSDKGVEDLMTLLTYRSNSIQKVVFVCDHTAPTYSNFSEIWQVIKTSEGSRIEQRITHASKNLHKNGST